MTFFKKIILFREGSSVGKSTSSSHPVATLGCCVRMQNLPSVLVNQSTEHNEYIPLGRDHSYTVPVSIAVVPHLGSGQWDDFCKAALGLSTATRSLLVCTYFYFRHWIESMFHFQIPKSSCHQTLSLWQTQSSGLSGEVKDVCPAFSHCFITQHFK